jgi:hypothetical protein
MSVKFANNTSKWQIEFNSAFKGLMVSMSRAVRRFYRIYSNSSAIQGDINNHRSHRDKSLKTKKTFHDRYLHLNYKFNDTGLLYIQGSRFNHVCNFNVFFLKLQLHIHVIISRWVFFAEFPLMMVKKAETCNGLAV